jgi:hypothetical protein
MPTSERQKAYNQKAREKKSKIKALSKELDDLVMQMEKLKHCERCLCGNGYGHNQCTHTPARKRLEKELSITRTKLAEIDH